MSVSFPGALVSREAGSDLSSAQYRFVTVAADGQVDLTGAGLAADGVTQDNNADEAGKAVGLMLLGGAVSLVEAGAAITRGVEITSDATGRAVTAGTGDRVLGRCWDTAGGAGEFPTVSLYMGPIFP